MDETVYNIAIGALLHDIGKVVQRAQKHPFDKKHGQWGYDWIKELGIFNNNIINSTITHHKDDYGVFNSNIGLIWYESDNLSSSERKESEEYEKEKWNLYTPLVSPFFKVRNPNNINEYLERIPYIAISSNKSLQYTSFEKPEITNKDYNQVLESFKEDIKEIHKVGIGINNLLMLIEKHFSKIPSITAEIFEKGKENIYKHPDISLYDHLKLTSAIATCMYYYYYDKYKDKWDEGKVLKDEILNGLDDAYLLIGGDISGVQKFIYTITSKGALKSLKGRSFFLELLTEHIVSELLKELELSRCNLIFAGGGHFYILAYNTKKAETAIKKVKTQMDNYLFNEFKGSIQVHIEFTSFDKTGFSNAVPVWQALSSKLENAKKRKWNEKIYDVIKVEDQSEDCKTQYCEVCFREDLPLKPIQRKDTTLLVCEPCKSQYDLGRLLSSISKESSCYIVKSALPINDSVKIGNYYYRIEFKKLDLKEELEAVYVINNQEVSNYFHPNSIYLPIGIYQHRSIEELSDTADVFGIERIAVLRMDVDNLGKIFSIAIPEEDRTFSRMASISRSLNYFFKYHLNLIVSGVIQSSLDITQREVSKKGRMVSIVYSGGDDLFIIGHWLDVLECAYDIRKIFQNFTGNKFLTISGGITINHENYPVYQFARDAEELEKSAKNGGKNSISIFNEKRIVNWDKFEKLLNRIELFKGYLEKGDKCLTLKEKGLPKTFFYRLLSLARRFNEEGVLILPKCAYLISRIKGDNNEINLKIKEVIMTVDKEEWEITEIATLLILMTMRKGGKENA